jgi:hypothetical protein
VRAAPRLSKAEIENSELRSALQRLLGKYIEAVEWNNQGYVSAAERLPEVIEARELLQRSAL